MAAYHKNVAVAFLKMGHSRPLFHFFNFSNKHYNSRPSSAYLEGLLHVICEDLSSHDLDQYYKTDFAITQLL